MPPDKPTSTAQSPLPSAREGSLTSWNTGAAAAGVGWVGLSAVSQAQSARAVPRHHVGNLVGTRMETDDSMPFHPPTLPVGTASHRPHPPYRFRRSRIIRPCRACCCPEVSWFSGTRNATPQAFLARRASDLPGCGGSRSAGSPLATGLRTGRTSVGPRRARPGGGGE